MGSNRDNGGGLSLATLAIASASSLAAALVVHKFWQAGAFVGAAITPVIVALVSEGLRKPVDVVKARTTTVNPPPVTPPREDPFGIWEEQRAPRRGRRKLHVGLALATGLVAFVIAAFFLTGAELVLGGASSGDKYRVLPGKQKKSDSDRDSQPATTQPADEEEQDPAPEATTPEEAPEETVPEEPVPEETTPEEVPEETVPPPVETTPEQPLP
jgi:hypothetical protein